MVKIAKQKRAVSVAAIQKEEEKIKIFITGALQFSQLGEEAKQALSRDAISNVEKIRDIRLPPDKKAAALLRLACDKHACIIRPQRQLAHLKLKEMTEVRKRIGVMPANPIDVIPHQAKVLALPQATIEKAKQIVKKDLELNPSGFDPKVRAAAALWVAGVLTGHRRSWKDTKTRLKVSEYALVLNSTRMSEQQGLGIKRKKYLSWLHLPES
jgi:hypothetical protein